MAEPVVVPDDVADPAGFVLAACDLREARIKAATPGPYEALSLHTIDGVDWQIHAGPNGAVWLYVGSSEQDRADAVHIAAEASPAHALAEVALWRGIAGRHEPYQDWCGRCQDRGGVVAWPCPDLLAVVAAARAYLGGQ